MAFRGFVFSFCASARCNHGFAIFPVISAVRHRENAAPISIACNKIASSFIGGFWPASRWLGKESFTAATKYWAELFGRDSFALMKRDLISRILFLASESHQ